jgi:hypothetical protein
MALEPSALMRWELVLEIGEKVIFIGTIRVYRPNQTN